MFAHLKELSDEQAKRDAAWADAEAEAAQAPAARQLAMAQTELADARQQLRELERDIYILFEPNFRLLNACTCMPRLRC